MKNIVYDISLIPLMVLAYFLGAKLNALFNKNIDEARNKATRSEIKLFSKKFNTRLSDTINKYDTVYSHYERIQNRLTRQGNPYHLTPITYYIIKILPSAALLFILIISQKLTILTIIFPAFAFFYIDLKHLAKNKTNEAEIRNDLPHVCSALEDQSYGDIPFAKSILSMHKYIKNKRLRAAFIDMAAEIIAKKNIPAALRKLEKTVPMPEIYSFTLAIEQGLDTGRIRDMLSSQRKIMNKKYLYLKEEETDKSNNKVSFCLLLLLTTTAALILYSFIVRFVGQLEFLYK